MLSVMPGSIRYDKQAANYDVVDIVRTCVENLLTNV